MLSHNKIGGIPVVGMSPYVFGRCGGAYGV